VTGLELNITILREIQDANMLAVQLQNLLDLIKTEEKLQYEPEQWRYYVLEQILNELRDFLQGYFTQDKCSVQMKELILRVLITIGTFRSSSEDFLVVYYLLTKQELELDLFSELSWIEISNTEDSMMKDHFSIDKTEEKKIQVNRFQLYNQNQNQITLWCDSKYVYSISNGNYTIFKTTLTNDEVVSQGTVIQKSTDEFKNWAGLTIINEVCSGWLTIYRSQQ